MAREQQRNKFPQHFSGARERIRIRVSRMARLLLLLRRTCRNCVFLCCRLAIAPRSWGVQVVTKMETDRQQFCFHPVPAWLARNPVALATIPALPEVGALFAIRLAVYDSALFPARNLGHDGAELVAIARLQRS